MITKVTSEVTPLRSVGLLQAHTLYFQQKKLIWAKKNVSCVSPIRMNNNKINTIAIKHNNIYAFFPY